MSSLPTGTVTFLFTDIEGSTRLLQDLRDRYAQALVDYRQLLRTASQKGNGYEVDTQGDAVFIAFSRAKDALATAVAAQRSILNHQWPSGISLRVRMGLHTGEPLHTDTAYVGLDVHRAARICAAGHGGQILLSQSTANLVEGDLLPALDLRDLGEHRLKDLQRPERIYQLVASDLPDVRTPLRSLSILPNNLPAQMTPFIGRAREIAELKALLSTRPLLTLTGFGGCGKTRLALQVAAEVVEEFPDGVWLAELADVADPALIPQVVTAALGVREEAGRSLTATLVDHLHEKRLLLVLDNCEHVITACAQFVHTLLTSVPDLRVLATSRESLGVPGEMTWPVPTLALPDLLKRPSLEELTQNEAVRLLVDRALAVRPGFAVTAQNASAVVEICHRLEGIPLAIELAAPQLRVLALPQVAARLEGGLRMVPAGRRTTARHRTLHAVMEWSYTLLEEPERTLLRRLSVFPGSFTLQAAEAICASDGIEQEAVLELLARLADKSLVMVEQNGESRYRLLETVRRYADEKLQEGSEAETLMSRYMEWYLALVYQAEPLLQISQEWLDRLEAEHSNVRGALDRDKQSGNWQRVLEFSAGLRRFWLVRGFWAEGRRWLEEALVNTPDAPPALRAKGLQGAASLAQHQADYDRAQVLCKESLAIYRSLDDKTGIAEALTTLGNILFERGEYAAARGVYEESLAYGRDADDKWSIGASLRNLANVLMHQGDFELAKMLCQESLAVFRQAGNKRGMASALNMLGMVAHDQEDFAAARKPLEEALVIHRQLGDKRGVAISLTDLGLLAWELRDYNAAVGLYEEALTIRRELGDKRGVATLLYDLGQVAQRQCDNPRATLLFSESLVMRHTAGNRAGVARSLEGLAHAARQDPQRAARLFGAAAALQETVGEVRSRSEEIEYEHAINEVRTVLGEGAFGAAWNEGRAMTLAQAVKYALASGTPAPNSSAGNPKAWA